MRIREVDMQQVLVALDNHAHIVHDFPLDHTIGTLRVFLFKQEFVVSERKLLLLLWGELGLFIESAFGARFDRGDCSRGRVSTLRLVAIFVPVRP